MACPSEPVAKARYLEKIKVIGGRDPYKINKEEWSFSTDDLPEVTYPDIFSYLVLEHSKYTADEFKAYKGLQAFNQVNNGWVMNVASLKPPSSKNVVVTAKVCHSQKMNEKPLSPWVIVEKDGKVLSAHCDCLAGLGETCTHVSAVLFYIETVKRMGERTTVTGKQAYWIKPSGTAKADPAPARAIDFTSAKSQRKHQLNSVKSPRPKAAISPSDIDSRQLFLSSIADANSVVLSVVEGHQEKFVVDMSVPDSLISLRDDKIHLPLDELVDHCSKLEIVVSQTQANAVERLTRSQSKSTLWKRLRQGRVTASRLHSVCHTNVSNPSLSLINSIVSPASFSTEATQWGIKMEETAKKLYMSTTNSSHTNFSITTCGLFINPEHPFMAATPDGIISCACCGRGCLEIKCPFKAKDMLLSQAAETIKDFCLQHDGTRLYLYRDHSYYYQVQCQMLLSNTDYCDFFVYTNSDSFCERIELDFDFIMPLVAKAELFFNQVLLPEIVACHFSATKVLEEKSCNNDVSCSVYCLCKKPEHGRMIECENASCTIQWFHYGCVGIKRAPKGKWYCSLCRPLGKTKRKVSEID